MVAAVGLALLGFWLWAPIGWLLSGLALWVAMFFRDPARVTPRDPAAVVSPADGWFR